MSIRLILLGFLNERPLYGYEIKQLIEHRMGDWTDVKFGSIYFSLDKLTKDGFIDKKGEIQEGARPRKTVYEINEAGRKEFLRLVREQWKDRKQDFYHFDLAVYNISFIPREEVEKFLQHRIEWHGRTLTYLDRHEGDFKKNPYIPPVAYAITDHSRMHLEAEKKWLEKLLENLDQYYT